MWQYFAQGQCVNPNMVRCTNIPRFSLKHTARMILDPQLYNELKVDAKFGCAASNRITLQLL